MRPSPRRIAVTAVALVAATLATMGIASAGHGAATLTGCLTAGGDLKNLAPGDAPAKDCGRNDTVVHLTDTDTTYTGSSFALSGQSCPPGQIVTGIGSSGSLLCQAPASSLPVARVGDATDGGSILQGSARVLAC